MQFQIFTKNAKKPIKLQLPIVMATYPVRNKDGTLKRRKGAAYPDSLPIFRPWLDGTLKKWGPHILASEYLKKTLKTLNTTSSN